MTNATITINGHSEDVEMIDLSIEPASNQLTLHERNQLTLHERKQFIPKEVHTYGSMEFRTSSTEKLAHILQNAREQTVTIKMADAKWTLENYFAESMEVWSDHNGRFARMQFACKGKERTEAYETGEVPIPKSPVEEYLEL